MLNDLAVIIHDMEGRITTCNATAARLYADDHNPLIGRSFEDLAPGGEASPIARAIERLDHHEQSPPMHVTHLGADGRRLEVEAWPQPVFDARGRMIAVTWIEQLSPESPDRGETKHGSRMTSATAFQSILELVRDVAQLSRERLTIQQMLRTALERIGPIGGWRKGHVYSATATSHDRLTCCHFWQSQDDPAAEKLKELSMNLAYSSEDELMARVLLTGQPIHLHDTRHDKNWQAQAELLNLNAIYLFPIRCERRTIALFEFLAPELTALDPPFITAMDTIGQLLGNAIDRRRMAARMALRMEREQQSLGHDLVNNLAQQVSGLSLLARTIHRNLDGRDPHEAARVAELLENIEHAKSQTRALSRGLLLVEVDAAGLNAALDNLAEQTQSLFSVRCEFYGGKHVEVADNFIATQLFRIARKAVLHLVQDCGATDIAMSLAGRSAVSVAVWGFATAPCGYNQETDERLGMMDYRAELIGANLSVADRQDGWRLFECTLSE